MSTRVRKAVEGDIDWIVDQLREFHKFYGDASPNLPDLEFALNYFKGLIKDHVLYLAEKEDGTRLGFIAGLFVFHPYNPVKKLLSEQFWWVAKEHQGSRAGLLLLKEFLAFGEEKADIITMSVLPQTPISDRVLTKYGFKLVEYSYAKEVTNGDSSSNSRGDSSSGEYNVLNR